ncbi:MAG: hypothetical protein IPN25_10890 [Sphingobacteriales bacterium]|nr:hypothetical protein [Sphingobacteriales bacterium]
MDCFKPCCWNIYLHLHNNWHSPCPNASATVSITISAKPQVALTPPAISPCNTAPKARRLILTP